MSDRKAVPRYVAECRHVEEFVQGARLDHDALMYQVFVLAADYDALDAERQRVENELACGGVTCHANQYLKERDEALARVEMLGAEAGYHDAQEVIRQLTSQRDAALATLAAVTEQRDAAVVINHAFKESERNLEAKLMQAEQQRDEFRRALEQRIGDDDARILREKV